MAVMDLSTQLLQQKALRMQGFPVAGAGFEPATFGL
jgi:hypothetical protein